MNQRVSGQLGDRDHQIVDPARRKPSPAGPRGGELPDLGQASPVPEHLGIIRRRAQRPVDPGPRCPPSCPLVHICPHTACAWSPGCCPAKVVSFTDRPDRAVRSLGLCIRRGGGDQAGVLQVAWSHPAPWAPRRAGRRVWPGRACAVHEETVMTAHIDEGALRSSLQRLREAVAGDGRLGGNLVGPESRGYLFAFGRGQPPEEEAGVLEFFPSRLSLPAIAVRPAALVEQRVAAR